MEDKYPDDFIIRDFRISDYDKVMQLWEETDLGNPERGDNAEIIEETINIGGALLVMEEKATSRIIGTSWMTYDGRRIHLHHFGVLPVYQGKGLANLLLEASLSFVKRKGRQVKLEVHSSNTKAINLYKKFGFGYLGDYKVYIIRDISSL